MIMKNSLHFQTVSCALFFIVLNSSCKPVGDPVSNLQYLAEAKVNSAGAREVKTTSVEQFNLAEWVSKKGVGGTNMKNNVKGTQYIFFSSNEEEKVDSANASEAAKSKNKANIGKPEYEMRMNATVSSDAKKAEMKSIFWIDGSLNGDKVFAGGNAVEASMIGSAKTAISVQANLKAFGKDLITQSVTLTKPFKFTKTIDLEAKQTLLGIPKIAGVEAGVSFVANASVSGEADYLDKESVSYSMVPAVKATAGIEGSVKALLFASATAKGTVTVLDTKMPSSATLGGRVGSGADFLYGNITFQSLEFSALAGDIVIGAKLSTAGAKLPAGVEAAFWSPNTAPVMATVRQKLDTGWSWIYKVWDSPALIKVKFPTAYSSSFLLSDAKKAACAKASTTKVVAEYTKEVGKDTGDAKKIGMSALASLKAIQAKTSKATGSCPIR